MWRQVGLGLSGLLFCAQVLALPVNIVFDNNTDISVNAFTAGNPGANIPAHQVNFSVPYIGVMARCNLGGMPKACPIEFYTIDTGDKFASVKLDVTKAEIIEPPVLYGQYAGAYVITGWDSIPVEHIKISPVSN